MASGGERNGKTGRTGQCRRSSATLGTRACTGYAVPTVPDVRGGRQRWLFVHPQRVVAPSSLRGPFPGWAQPTANSAAGVPRCDAESRTETLNRLTGGRCVVPRRHRAPISPQPSSAPPPPRRAYFVLRIRTIQAAMPSPACPPVVRPPISHRRCVPGTRRGQVHRTRIHLT